MIINSKHVGGGADPVINPLSVTANGTYTAPSGVDGYSPVTVNVQGGGSLPSSISKIDGGSFTVAADTPMDEYLISHNLGVKPDGYIIWTNDVPYSGALAVQSLMYAVYKQMALHSDYVGTYTLTRKPTSGNPVNYTSFVSSTSEPNWITTTTIKINIFNNSYYQGEATYHWFAWA